MFRTTHNASVSAPASARRSIFEKLEGRAMFNAAAVDFNGDGLISGDDFGPLDSNGGTPAQYACLANALSLDFNQDQLVTGDDHAWLDSNGGTAEDHERLTAFLAEETPVVAQRIVGAGNNVDFNGDGVITGDDFMPLDSDGGTPEQYAALANALSLDFNQDQVITSDDYTYLDSNGGDIDDYARLAEFLGDPAPVVGVSESRVARPATADFNEDGLVTGDDYTWLDSNNGTADEYARLDKAISVDFNQDQVITGDDFIHLDSNGGTAEQYQALSEVLGIA